jgi:hypothetical protein
MAGVLLLSSIAAPPAFADLAPPPSLLTPFDPFSFVFIAVFAASLFVLSSTWSASKKSGSWTRGMKVKAIVSGVMLGLTGLVLVPTTIVFVVNPPPTPAERQAQLKRWDKEKAAERNQAPIFYSVKDLPKGSTVVAPDLEERLIRSDRVPPGAVTGYKSVVGRMTAVDIPQGTVLLDDHLEPIAQKDAPTAKSAVPGDKASAQTTATMPKRNSKPK